MNLQSTNVGVAGKKQHINSPNTGSLARGGEGEWRQAQQERDIGSKQDEKSTFKVSDELLQWPQGM